MSYTVSQAYERILEEGDKLGSDYFTLPQVLAAFKKETLSFVGSKAKQVELNQEITDDLRPLLVPTLISFIPNPDNNLEKMATVPNNYHTKVSVNVLYTDGLKARQPLVERHGEHNTNSVSPYRKANKQYPLIQQFSNYFNVVTNIASDATVQPSKLILMYIKNPTFGAIGTDSVVNLSDSVCEYLFGETANHLRFKTGDPSAPQDFQVNQAYRNK